MPRTTMTLHISAALLYCKCGVDQGVCWKSMQRTTNMHVLTFTSVSASETQFNMTCWQTDEQTNKLVDGLKIGKLMRPFRRTWQLVEYDCWSNKTGQVRHLVDFIFIWSTTPGRKKSTKCRALLFSKQVSKYFTWHQPLQKIRMAYAIAR